jgi:hypothetical protein
MPHSDYILFHSNYFNVEVCLTTEIVKFTGNEESKGLNFGVGIIDVMTYHSCE